MFSMLHMQKTYVDSHCCCPILAMYILLEYCLWNWTFHDAILLYASRICKRCFFLIGSFYILLTTYPSHMMMQSTAERSSCMWLKIILQRTTWKRKNSTNLWFVIAFIGCTLSYKSVSYENSNQTHIYNHCSWLIVHTKYQMIW